MTLLFCGPNWKNKHDQGQSDRNKPTSNVQECLILDAIISTTGSDYDMICGVKIHHALRVGSRLKLSYLPKLS